MSLRRLILIGGGGHSLVVADIATCCGYVIEGVVDRSPACKAVTIGKLNYLGSDEILQDLSPLQFDLINAIGSERDVAIRRRVFEMGRSLRFSFVTLVHPSAFVAASALIGEGSIVCAGAIIQPFARLSEDVLVNTSARIDHECEIGAHSHIAPGAVLSGCIIVGASSHIGCGAVIIQNIQIGPGSLVAAGSVVISDVKRGSRVKGVPAKEFEL